MTTLSTTSVRILTLLSERGPMTDEHLIRTGSLPGYYGGLYEVQGAKLVERFVTLVNPSNVVRWSITDAGRERLKQETSE